MSNRSIIAVTLVIAAAIAVILVNLYLQDRE